MQTLLRPEAQFDRLLYTGIANVAIGQIGALALLGMIFRWTGTEAAPSRFEPLNHRTVAVLAAVILGLGYYLAAGGPVGNAAGLANAFAQVMVVSAAEVIVCWGLLGIATDHALRPRLGAWSVAGAAVAGVAGALADKP
jgi:hypothetical protein